jgi:hypothetical protein
MKKIVIVFIAILLIISAWIMVSSSRNKENNTTEVVVLRDYTDSMLALPAADEIIAFYNLSGSSKWIGAFFRCADITDVSLNSAWELKLKEENQWLSNELERHNEIKKFKSSISDILSRTIKAGKSYSSVYIPMAKELKRLSESTSQRRILIIYSDLMENTLEISLYDTNEFKLLKSNPDFLQKYFENLQPLPSLAGIEIHIVYHPLDISKDNTFKIVSGFYKKMLEEKGASVTISANLSN